LDVDGFKIDVTDPIKSGIPSKLEDKVEKNLKKRML
jgi:hypothetical protein